MPNSELLQDLEQQTTNELLKSLLEVHDPLSGVSQERKVSALVVKLDEILKERLHETPTH